MLCPTCYRSKHPADTEDGADQEYGSYVSRQMELDGMATPTEMVFECAECGERFGLLGMAMPEMPDEMRRALISDPINALPELSWLAILAEDDDEIRTSGLHIATLVLSMGEGVVDKLARKLAQAAARYDPHSSERKRPVSEGEIISHFMRRARAERGEPPQHPYCHGCFHHYAPPPHHGHDEEGNCLHGQYIDVQPEGMLTCGSCGSGFTNFRETTLEGMRALFERRWQEQGRGEAGKREAWREYVMGVASALTLARQN